MKTTRKDTSILQHFDTISFTKMSGSGNDFVFINLVDHPIPEKSHGEIAVLLAERRMSVGADGVIFVEPMNTLTGEFRWYFYNNDGSIAEMCGNGSRCAFAYAKAEGWLTPDGCGVLHTVAGRISGQVFGSRDVRIRMTPYRDYSDNVTFHTGGAVFVGAMVDTGVPHVVVQVDDVDGFDLQTYGSGIRNHAIVAPRGSNVNFIERVEGSDVYRVRTFERGVEAETLACGTGFSAVGVHLVLSGRSESPVGIKTSCGDTIWVAIEDASVAQSTTDASTESPDANPHYDIFLRGEVDFIYDGVLRLGSG